MVRSNVDANSRQESLTKSRLPVFTEEEIQSLKGSADFLGLNYFTSYYAESGTAAATPSPSFERDRNVIESYASEWPMASSEWLRSAPDGLSEVLKYVFIYWHNHHYFNNIFYNTLAG